MNISFLNFDGNVVETWRSRWERVGVIPLLVTTASLFPIFARKKTRRVFFVGRKHEGVWNRRSQGSKISHVSRQPIEVSHAAHIPHIAHIAHVAHHMALDSHLSGEHLVHEDGIHHERVIGKLMLGNLLVALGTRLRRRRGFPLPRRDRMVCPRHE